MSDAFTEGEKADSPYPLLFEAVPDAMIVVDNQGIILLANSKACELFGWTHAELSGAKVERLIPSRFVGSHEQHRQRYNKKPESRPMGIELELFGLRRDGTEFPLEIALSPFALGAASLVAASIRDLTHTLRFKEATKRARYSAQLVKLGELALRAQGIDELLKEVPNFIIDALRADIVVIYWADRDAGLRPRVIHGIPNAVAENPDTMRAIVADGAGMAINQQSIIFGNYFEEPDIDATLVQALGIASGLRVPLTGRAGPVGLLVAHSRQTNRFGKEELQFMQAVGNVITEAFMRGEIEEQLAHAQRLESIGQLTGGIAHDFNNILTVVLGNLQMLREVLEQHGGDGFVKLVESAQRAAKRGADLTQKLLTFSRKQSLAPVAIDLASALDALANMLQRTIGEAIQIEWDVAPGCPACMADALQFDNAIVNLALNARDAMSGGGRLHIVAASLVVDNNFPDLAAELAPGEYVVISVIDTGCGMSPEILSRAYEPFFTTKPSGKGSGLGLSMVYGFAKQSGGTVQIDSEPGRGTQVRLYFPAANRSLVTGISWRNNEAQDFAAPARQETVLIVDDDLDVLNIAEVFLIRSGYRVLRATTIMEAMHWLTGPESISLLFTDVVLGAGETGPQLATEAEKIQPYLPVLYTSGFARGSLSVADVRPVQFLAKPYLCEELAARIEILLNEGRHAPKT